MGKTKVIIIKGSPDQGDIVVADKCTHPIVEHCYINQMLV